MRWLVTVAARMSSPVPVSAGTRPRSTSVRFAPGASRSSASRFATGHHSHLSPSLSRSVASRSPPSIDRAPSTSTNLSTSPVGTGCPAWVSWSRDERGHQTSSCRRRKSRVSSHSSGRSEAPSTRIWAHPRRPNPRPTPRSRIASPPRTPARWRFYFPAFFADATTIALTPPSPTDTSQLEDGRAWS